MCFLKGGDCFARIDAFILLLSIVAITWSACVIERVEAKEFPSLDHLKTSTPEAKQADTVLAMIGRQVGSRSSNFSVVIDSTVGPAQKDTFKLATKNGVLYITGSTGVAAAWGFYYYVSQYCGCHVSWGGSQFNLPATLPDLPPDGLVVTSADRFRYYQNVCTTSYSFVWWDWARWEREIDWMAMNGINLPLSFNAQEAIWQKVFLNMGFTQLELDNHFGGAAFLSWSRMGNMHGWGGPLPQNWHGQQLALQHQILQRMRDFGMIPVLPAFPGHVPNAIARVFPSAKVSPLTNWCNFNSTYCCTLLLDVQDPLFQQIGKAFLLEYINEFGTDHIYNTDTFNEMTPKSSDPTYLSLAGKAVYDAMLAADDKAIWLMQGWLFLAQFWQPPQAKALLTSVPQFYVTLLRNHSSKSGISKVELRRDLVNLRGKMIILDLFSEVLPQFQRLSSYYGQPFIWCMLHNFGGMNGLYGVINTINTGPSSGRSFPGSTMIGIGITPEGINQNDMIYEFMLENGWRAKPRNITQWISDYSRRRYGSSDPNANYAWQILQGGVYNCRTGIHYHGRDYITSRPSRNIKNISGGVYNAPGQEVPSTVLTERPSMSLQKQIWYSTQQFFDAWDHFVLASNKLSSSMLFRYDLVDVSRQALDIIFGMYYTQMINSFKTKNITSFRSSSDALLNLLMDFDSLLASDVHFLLGNWLESAKALGTIDAEKALYEYNARNQITLWGPTGNILDYARKHWAGLVKAYYYPRWNLFVGELFKHWNDSFSQDQFNTDVFNEVESPFTFDRTVFSTTPEGDQISVATMVNTKYKQVVIENRAYFKHLDKRIHKQSNSIHGISSNVLYYSRNMLK